MNYNTDCSNSSRLPLVDHTDQFHQTQSTPFYRGLCGTHRFTYSHQNSYTYRSHQPNDFHADSQSSNLLHPTGSRPCWIVWKNTFRVISCTHPRVFIRSPQTWSTWSHDTEDVKLQRDVWNLQWLVQWLSLLSTSSWFVVNAYTWLALWLSLLSTCSWCVASASTWLALCLSLLSTCSWFVARAYTWLAIWLSLLSTCSWCVVSASTWLALCLSLLSTCSWCVASAYTWLALCLSLLSTCSWCVASAYTWLALCLSLLSTCSWCGLSAYTW